MKVVAFSDPHGYLPKLKDFPECDVVCIAGDICPLDVQRDLVESISWFLLEFKPWAESLPCKKVIFVGGNHDDKKCCREYARLGITVLGCLEYKGFFCTHVPIHPGQLEFCRGNIHGHIHKQRKNGEVLEQLEGRYYNVNCEFNNYTPVLFDDIVKYFNEIGY